jgi:dimethylhistidine N-methyltransferase
VFPIAEEDCFTSAAAARSGLLESQKTLPPWLFYDEAGSQLFEDITQLPEYYLTRTERALLEEHADEIILIPPDKMIVELGAGTATKTGILLREAVRQALRPVIYQPIDISPSALEEARENIVANIPGVIVRPLVANYVTDKIHIRRERNHDILALYIGSSIGNFSPAEARAILTNLRSQLQPGDSLLLGTDLAPGRNKSVQTLLAAYDDAAGVTAAFNLNILVRLNRELGADFDLDRFAHQARWNATESRIEMHLVSTCTQTVTIPANSAGPAQTLQFAAGETIHTENSYKFTPQMISGLLTPSGFQPNQTFYDPDCLYALTLAQSE